MNLFQGPVSPYAPAFALGALLFVAANAPADPIRYDYNFLTPQAVTGDPGNLGAVSFATTAGGHIDSAQATVTAATLAAATSAPVSAPDTFSGQSYNLTLQLTDDASGSSGSLTFVGRLFGTLSSQNVDITTSFDSTSKSLLLGNYIYTVTLDPFAFDPNPTLVGTLQTTISVRSAGEPAAPNSLAPEPSAFVLACSGPFVAGILLRLGRPRRHTAPPDEPRECS